MKKPSEILQTYWGYGAFRPMQEEIITHVLEGKDTVALLPTGGGKSICFQVPAIAMDGMAIVVSPLIALMKDQVENLVKLGVKATFLHGGMMPWEIDRTLQDAMDGNIKFLYLAPERIQSEMFRLRVPAMNISLLVVDEAHCISQWGYDFRPSYMHIPEIREIKPDIPIIAVTASATQLVREDIIDKLHLNRPGLFSKSFRRDNLRYFVIEEENAASRVLEICRRTQGSGIVYARTRKRVAGLAEMLISKGISAAAYHGGMATSDRNAVQSAWISGDTRIMVATNAFGMGIDKPDVRFVVHYNMPLDLESYYQEAGRGGRDGKTALAIAFDNPIDKGEAKRWVETKYPTWEEVQRHYRFLVSHFNIPNTGTVNERFSMDIKELATISKESLIMLFNSIKLLDREGLLKLEEDSDDYGVIRVRALPPVILNFKHKNPKEGLVLDHALRTLGGEVFNYDLRFLPGNWANALQISPAELQDLLHRLVKFEMIFYRPPSGTPMLSFFRPKIQLTKADLDWDKYEFLRKQSQLRFGEMIKFVETTEVCRSLMIQHYFGEESHTPCGKCDVCIGRHKTKVSDQDFNALRSAILEMLRSQKVTYREVVTGLGKGTPAQREKVLRYLMDKAYILSDRLGTLRLKEPDS